jgi:hypothetical protein
MSFSIQDMKTTLAKYNGFYKPSHFYVRVTPPGFLITDPVNRDLEFLCESTSLPGMHFDTAQVRPMGYGNPESRPTDYVPSEVRCDFFIDNKNAVMSYFHKWMGSILNFGRDVRRASSTTGLNYYEYAYPKEYEGQVQIYAFNGEGAEVIVYTLDHAWPVNIGEVTVAWEINDQVSKLPVTWAYNLWHAETLPFTKAAREIGQRVQFPIQQGLGTIFNNTPNNTLGPNGQAGATPTRDGIPGFQPGA